MLVNGSMLRRRKKKRKEVLSAIRFVHFLVFEINKKRFSAAGNTMGHACA